MRILMVILTTIAATTTKTAILNAAENAVRKKGYNGFGLDQVARDAGIQKSSIFYHFASKSELIAATFRRFSHRIFSVLENAENTASGAGDRLMTYIMESRDLIEDGESICLAIALNIDQQSLQAEIVDDLALFHRTNVEWLTGIFELGLRDGSISDIGDPVEEAHACLALVDGAQMMARAHRNSGIYDQATGVLRSRISIAAPNNASH